MDNKINELVQKLNDKNILIGVDTKNHKYFIYLTSPLKHSPYHNIVYIKTMLSRKDTILFLDGIYAGVKLEQRKVK